MTQETIFKPLPNHHITYRHKTLDLSVPRVMGVLNVTPDSFSDGGRFQGVDKALTHAQAMLEYGADIIDIGGESTRPNAAVVHTDEELCRVIPVIRAIRERFGDETWLSIDTSNPVVMYEAIHAGADIVNDVRALRKDCAKETVAKLGCPVVLMHSRGEPDTMNGLAVYNNVVAELVAELDESICQAVKAGIKRENIIIDVGMGFAKNYEHHQRIMRHLGDLVAYFGLPMLFGVSRKRYLGESLQAMGLAYLREHAPEMRDNVGVLAHMLAIQQGVSIVRVHDVKNMVQAVKFWTQLTKN